MAAVAATLLFVDREALRTEALKLGLDLTDEQLQAFEAFEEDLYEANKVMNLTRVPREECWIRHFLDSLLFQDLIPEGAEVLDLGTGPGFPAWPLALARPDLVVDALDSSGKMLGFLRRHPLPNLTPIQYRAEEWGVEEAYDFVTGRALAPLAIQLELSAKRCKVGGVVLPLRTASDESEIERLGQNPLGLQLKEVHRRMLPLIDAPRVFPVFRKAKPTPRTFPRRWAEIKAKPL